MPTKLLTEKEQKKLDDWNRIFPPRVHKAIYHIKLLDNCSNKRNYLWPKNLAKRYFLLLAAYIFVIAEDFGLPLQIYYKDTLMQPSELRDLISSKFKLDDELSQ